MAVRAIAQGCEAAIFEPARSRVETVFRQAVHRLDAACRACSDRRDAPAPIA
jgi:hypothetical protein